MSNKKETRRDFIKKAGVSTGALGLLAATAKAEKVIQGFDETETDIDTSKIWQQKYDRKVKVGIVGFGACSFGAAFGFQDHPNVEVVAVSDLIPDRCAGLAKACRCEKTYPSLEKMVKDDSIEAIFCATDAPSHARHCMLAMNHGKHVAVAVPAVFGNLEHAHQLFETVKKTGLNYMMFETSCYHDDLYAMRQLYKKDHFGKIIYSEGEYYHYAASPISSYKGWRVGSPPLWYPTHATAYYCGVTGGNFTDVSCQGMKSIVPMFSPENNPYNNPFGSEFALLRTSEGGTSRMLKATDTPGVHGERGRIYGQKAAYYGTLHGGPKVAIPKKPQLPPGVSPGGHGGAHGYLMNEFVMSILENRKPWIDITMSLNMSVAGVVAHQSALKDGERLKIPQFVM